MAVGGIYKGFVGDINITWLDVTRRFLMALLSSTRPLPEELHVCIKLRADNSAGDRMRFSEKDSLTLWLIKK